ncbi:MAG: DUF1573 domain-containing protein [Lentimicrobiaceae bacterium]|nr:DUF1573 domain-containing protein [Lentimicrobiaceae bacterium]
MKKLMLVLAAGLMLGLMGYAQAPVQQAENPNAPEITFKSTVYDYGTVYKDGDGNCEFQFTNTGKEPLVLSNVRSSCGCTVPEWTREPILPGKSGTIKVRYDTRRLGAINKHVTVLSNAKNSSVVLRIAGNVVDPPAEAAPQKTDVGGVTPKAK